MRVVRDGLRLCSDCMCLHETGDATSFGHHYGKDADARLMACETGLAGLGPHLVLAWDSETGAGIHVFSWAQCDACGTRLGGARYEYATLGRD